MREIASVKIDGAQPGKPKVIIFHGYTGSCENARYQNLPYETIKVNVDHDRLTWQETYEIYDKIVKKAIEDWEGNIILLGHSLGGWWARYFVKQYGLTAVLLNPLVDLKTIDIDIPDRAEYEKHMADIEHKQGGSITYYIEQPDEVINFEPIIEALHKDGKVIIKQGGHHRIEWPENIPQLLIDANNRLCLQGSSSSAKKA